MSNATEGTAATPVVEEGPEGGNDDEERVEEIVDLRTCHPKPNERSLVWTQCRSLAPKATTPTSPPTNSSVGYSDAFVPRSETCTRVEQRTVVPGISFRRHIMFNVH